MSMDARLSRLRSSMRGALYKETARLLSSSMPYYVVNEFPKSGGTWLSEMLAEALDVPFRKHRALRLERSIVHGHFLSPLGLRNVVVLWRDPRDVMVSFYHYCYFVNEFRNAPLVRLMKERLPFDNYEDVRANLPAFIRFVFTTPVSPTFTWAQFARVWYGRPGVVETSYEDLRQEPSGTLRRVVWLLTGVELPADLTESVAERHAFDRVRERLSARNLPGVEMSFLREGAVGGWRQHFSEEAEREMRRHCGAEMGRLGYGPPGQHLSAG